MNELQIFNNAEFGTVRTLEIDGKPYFVASDVAKTLGYANPRDAILRHCKGVVKHDGVSKTTNQYGTTTEQTVELNFIPEGDIYRLITHSKLPSAERFETWVFDEVLPSIRKNGGYIAGQENLSDDELLAKAVMVAQKKIAERDAIIEKQAERIEADRPKTLFADAVTASNSTILVGELAKIIRQNGYETGEKRLFAQLRNEGYLIKRKGIDYNMPTQKSIEMGLFEIKETAVNHADGHVTVRKTPKVTGKGQQYFINKFLNK